MYLEVGYHPQIFKTAILYILPKLGKYPHLLSCYYWLIVLLSHLGKALECIVIRYLSNTALKNELFRLFHFGATFCCLAVDFAAILIHNIEKVFFVEEIMNVLTFHIKRAFIHRVINR